MRAWYGNLPIPIRVIAVIAASALVLVGLLLVYDWIGTSLLDTGGTVG